jgi:hypothetical protein
MIASAQCAWMRLPSITNLDGGDLASPLTPSLSMSQPSFACAQDSSGFYRSERVRVEQLAIRE